MNGNAVAGPSRSASRHATASSTTGTPATALQDSPGARSRLRPPRRLKPVLGTLGADAADRYARVAQASAAPRAARIMLTFTHSTAATSALSHSGHQLSALDKGKARAIEPVPTTRGVVRRQDSPIVVDGSDDGQASTGAKVAAASSASAPTAGSSSVAPLSAGASSVPLVGDGATVPLVTRTQVSSASSSMLSPPLASSSAGTESITAATTAAVQSLAPASLVRNAAAAAASTSAASDGAAPHVSLKHNLPLQLLITVGALVVFASLLASSAWLCRTRLPCSRRRKKLREKATWSPAASSAASFEVKSVDARQWAAKYAQTPMLLKEDAQQLCPGPALPMNAAATDLQRPAPCAVRAHSASNERNADQQASQRGYQLWDAPMTSPRRQSPRSNTAPWQGLTYSGNGGGTYATGTALAGECSAPARASAQECFEDLPSLPPARRPSFIERLMVARPNSTGLPDALRGDEEQRISNPHSSIEHDMMPASVHLHETFIELPDKGQKLANQPPATRSATLLSSVLSTFGVHPTGPSKRAHKVPSRDLDSDFEGTIGAKDVELPMARRVGKRESRFPCDVSSDEDSAATLAILSRARRACNASEEQMSSTPKTPGLAGLGSAWARVAPIAAGAKRPSPLGAHQATHLTSTPTVPQQAARSGEGGRRITLAELKLMQSQKDLNRVLSPASNNRRKLDSTVARWLGTSRYADVIQQTPLTRLPAVLSRRDSGRSLTQSEGSSMTLASSGGDGLSNAPSIVPRFGATTTLESWLEEGDIKKSGSDAGVSDLVNILGMYSMDVGDDRSSAGSDTLSLASARPEQHLEKLACATPMLSLPTGDSILPPSYRSFGSPDRVQIVGAKSSAEVWDETQEMLEEERRQVDRRQKLHRKDQRRSARIHARHLALCQEAEAQQDDQAACVEEAQDRRHTILDFAMLTAGQSPRVGVTRSRSLASSVYSSNTAISEYCNAPILSNTATANRLSVIQELKSPSTSGTISEHRPAEVAQSTKPLQIPVQQKNRSTSSRLVTAPLSPPDSPWTSPDSRTGAQDGRWQGGPHRPRDSFIVPKRPADALAKGAATISGAKWHSSRPRRDVIPPTGHLIDVTAATAATNKKKARRVVSALPAKQLERPRGAERRGRAVSDRTLLA